MSCEKILNSKNCIIFDCDGVLVDSEPLAARAYQKVYFDSGLTIAASVMQDCIGLKQIDIITKIAEMTGHYLPLEQHAQIWPETRKLFERALKPTYDIDKFLSVLTQARCVASSSSLE